MDYNDITYKIRGAIFNVYNTLGPGLLERVYETAMVVELRGMGLQVQSQIPISLIYKGVDLELGFRLDLLVEDRVIVEIKSIEMLQPVHSKQLQTYLKLTDKRLGILVNFNCPNINDGIIRIANDL